MILIKFRSLDSATFDDLKRICGIDCGLEEIKSLPDFFNCTAIGRYGSSDKCKFCFVSIVIVKKKLNKQM